MLMATSSLCPSKVQLLSLRYLPAPMHHDHAALPRRRGWQHSLQASLAPTLDMRQVLLEAKGSSKLMPGTGVLVG